MYSINATSPMWMKGSYTHRTSGPKHRRRGTHISGDGDLDSRLAIIVLGHVFEDTVDGGKLPVRKRRETCLGGIRGRHLGSEIGRAAGGGYGKGQGEMRERRRVPGRGHRGERSRGSSPRLRVRNRQATAALRSFDLFSHVRCALPPILSHRPGLSLYALDLRQCSNCPYA